MRIAAGALFSVVVVSLWLRSFSGTAPGQALAAERQSQFRIVFGLTDTTRKKWEGTVKVSGGEIASLVGWRFSEDDRADLKGSFAFTTKIGLLEDQLLTEYPYGQTNWSDPKAKRLIPEGLILRVRGGTAVQVQTGQGTFDIPADVTLGKIVSWLGGNATAERLPVEEKLSEAGPADDYASLAVTPDGSPWVAWLSYQNGGDEILVRGAGKLHKITERGDHHAPTIAADGKGQVRVAWSQNESGTFHIYSRVWDGSAWSQAEKLSGPGGSNIWPQLVSDGQSRMALVWQGFRNSQSVVLAKRFENGRWQPETPISQGPGNCWMPAAVFAGDKLWIAWDSYATGNYQIYARQDNGPVQRVTHDANFSVRPSIAIGAAGKPVIAWEESDPLWGKDFAFLFDRRGTVIYKSRRIRAAYLDGGQWLQLPSAVENSLPANIRRFVQQPRISSDADGRLYLAFRTRVSTGTSRMDYWANNGRWETYLTHLESKRWAPAIAMPSSVGRNGMRASLLLHGGLAHMAWSTDNRIWPGFRYGDLDVYSTAIPVEGDAVALSGGKAMDSVSAAVSTHPNEAADTARIRSYRIEAAGKQFRIVRGDMHRHTELSNDGAGDGQLDDLYRYFLDAASMDYAHVGDHQMGNDEEYNWWITQKSNDLYYMANRFVPMYGYERSVWWPNGHRNVVWAERGKPVLKIGPAEAKGDANSGPILYPYLRQTDGIAMSHSSATEQGTDWRDNDPSLEPLVEIFQGFENSYEAPGAPRTAKPGEALVHQGIRPAGYVWNAWAKGYKLGVQASSDHISTHSSYACILVEDFTRKGIIDAIRKRHAYAATDQIVLDFKIGDAIMGDVVQSAGAPKLIFHVIGTNNIKQIDVIRNNQYIHKVNPGQKEARMEYIDNTPPVGDAYYYVRVEQEDGQLAWTSPIWLTRHL